MPQGAVPFPFGDCRVCCDRATGVHYGVATCEGCKGFFKRSIPKADKYKCFFGSQCMLTPQNRNRCKACRFQRCLKAGMSIEAVKMGRIPKVDKDRALEEHRRGNEDVRCPPMCDASPQNLPSDPGPPPMMYYSNNFPISQDNGSGSGSGVSGSELDSGVSDLGSDHMTESPLQSFPEHPRNFPRTFPNTQSSDRTQGRDVTFSSSYSRENYPTEMMDMIDRKSESDADSDNLDIEKELVLMTDDLDQHPKEVLSPDMNIRSPSPYSTAPCSPFSPGVIKELINQVIESGNGAELQRTLITRFAQKLDDKPEDEEHMHGSRKGYCIDDTTPEVQQMDMMMEGININCSSHVVDSKKRAVAKVEVEPDNGSPPKKLLSNEQDCRVPPVLHTTDQNMRPQRMRDIRDHDLSKLSFFMDDPIDRHEVKIDNVSQSLPRLEMHSPRHGDYHPKMEKDGYYRDNLQSLPHELDSYLGSVAHYKEGSQVMRTNDLHGSVCSTHLQRPPQDRGYNDILTSRYPYPTHQHTNLPHTAHQSSFARSYSSPSGYYRNSVHHPNYHDNIQEQMQHPQSYYQAQDLTQADYITALSPSSTAAHPSWQPAWSRSRTDSVTMTPSSRGQAELRIPPVTCPQKWDPSHPPLPPVSSSVQPPSSCYDLNSSLEAEAKATPQTPTSFLAIPEGFPNMCGFDGILEALQIAGKPIFEHISTDIKSMEEDLSRKKTPHPLNCLQHSTRRQVQYIWDQLMSSIPTHNQVILGMCRNIPGLTDLDAKDQTILMQDAYFDIWLILNSALFRTDESYMLLPCGARYSRWWMCHFLPEYLVQDMFQFATELNDCSLSECEIMILMAIQLINPMRNGITEPSRIKSCHNWYLDILAHIMEKNHPTNHGRLLINIFRILPKLTSINQKQAEVIGNLSLDHPPEGCLKWVENGDEESVAPDAMNSPMSKTVDSVSSTTNDQ